MNNQLYSIDITKPKCLHKTNGSIIITDLSNGLLSFSWLDVPNTASVADYGRAIYNLNCGIYTLDIYNIRDRTTETIAIDLSCPNELSIDLIQMDELLCYNDTSDLFIEWSGGQPPYNLSINAFRITTDNTSYTYKIRSNNGYNISIIDSYGCVVSKNDIKILSEQLSVDVRWEPITEHKGKSPNVSCIVSGGKPPYRIAWFIDTDKQPIVVNQTSINDKLYTGNYRIVVIDDNGCEIQKTFTISEPPPLAVNISTFNDYSTRSLFDPVSSHRVHNLLLLPEHKDSKITQESLLKSSSIFLKYNNIKIEQKLCMDYGSIEIDEKTYNYYYISPGLQDPKTHKLKLIVDDVECDLEHVFGSNRPKLVIGSLIMNNDHSFAYKNQDIVRIYSTDNENIDAQVHQVYIKAGLYLSPSIYTIINFIHPTTTDPNVLLFVNKHNNLSVQSLTTKSNKRLGSIRCNVLNANKSSLQAILINEYNESEIFSFNNQNNFTIDNIKYGQYRIIIKDKNSTAYIYNQKNINTEYYSIDILDSSESEREQSMIQSANIYHIDPSLLNVYNKPPNKLLFSDPEYKNGVLMNISPTDSCYNIVGEKINITDCGYKIIKDLPYGKYSIRIFKDGYKTQKLDLFYHTNKELVTTILERQ